jgi:hypothetical protein
LACFEEWFGVKLKLSIWVSHGDYVYPALCGKRNPTNIVKDRLSSVFSNGLYVKSKRLNVFVILNEL